MGLNTDSTKTFIGANWKPIVFTLAIIITFMFIAFTIGTYHPQSTMVTKLVDQQIKQDKAKFESDLKALQTKYVNDIKQKDLQISQLQGQIQISDAKYKATKKQIDMLRKEMNNYVLPKNMAEAKARLVNLNYKPF